MHLLIEKFAIEKKIDWEMDLLTILFVSIRVTPVDLHLIQFTWIVFNSKHKLLNFN